MTQARVLHRQSIYNDLCILPQGFSQSQHLLDYSSQAPEAAPEATDQFGNLTYGISTAEAMLQRQYRSESHLLSSTWSIPHTTSQAQLPPIAAPPGATPSSGYLSQNQVWSGGSSFGNNAFGWGSGLPMKSSIMSGPEYHYLRNNELSYSHMSGQSAMDKDANTYGGHESWLSSRPSTDPRQVVVNASELDTNTSPSPKGYMDGKLESEPYSPVSILDQGPSSDDWSRYSTSFPCVKESSPKSISQELHPLSVPTPTAEHLGQVNLSSLPPMGMSNSILAGYQGDGWPNSMGYTRNDSEYSYSHRSSPRSSPWDHPGFSHDRKRQDLYLSHAHGDNSSSSNFSQNNTRQQVASWSESRLGVPTRSMLQDRTQVPRSADAQGQRKLNDDILIQGKKEGLTYKEIRKKMVGERPAESTLRGRYRALTKARKDRVRKPVWMERDLELLNEFVEHELDRIENTLSHPQALNLAQKLVKVQWKKVADYVHEQGGSYHFGNSTCKRKWLEINKGS